MNTQPETSAEPPSNNRKPGKNNGFFLKPSPFIPRKFLFISNESLSGDLAWRLTREGHEVKMCIKSKECADVYDGFFEKVKKWKTYAEWADVIIFDDIGFGKEADRLRRQGKFVIGGSIYTDQLELSREFGQAELRKHNINTLRWWQFSSYDQAIDFIRQHPDQYVFKPSGSAPKSLLFIGQDEDGRDILELFLKNKLVWQKRAPSFVLQKFVSGVEVAVGALFNGHDFIRPININFEHKRIFPGNLGPFTGEMGTLMYWSSPNMLYKTTLERLIPSLRASAYVGYVDINCMVNAKGIYPLEFTCRFGYPTIHIQLEGILMPLGDWLYRLGKGEFFELRTKKGFQVGVRLLLPMYFNQELHSELVDTYRGLAINFKNRQNLEGFHIEDIKNDKGVWRVAGTSGCVLVVTGSGATVEEARRVVYSRVQNVEIPNMFYRMDIGSKWAQDSDRLHTWGYLR